MQTPPLLFELFVLVFSIIIHEISHGYAAEFLGDPTPRLQGRLSLNPLKHIDPVGSIIVPIITYMGGFTFGWAKPVQINPYNLRNRRFGELIVALAGPFSNLLIALVFGSIIRFELGSSIMFLTLCGYVAIINIALAVFNLIPLPPLDGSKIVFAFFPRDAKWARIRATIEHYSIFLVLFVIIFVWQYITPVIPFIFKLFTGIQ